VFFEIVRKNGRDCLEKKDFDVGNRHFQGTANFGYLEAMKCHFERLENENLDEFLEESDCISFFAHCIWL